MNVFSIKTTEHIEEILFVFYKYLPPIPQKIKTILVEILPYISALFACIFFLSGILPAPFTLVHFHGLDLLNINVIILRIVYILFSILLYLSFSPLSSKKIKGWFILFNTSLMIVIVGLAFFNIPYIIAILILWHILFQIKSSYLS